MFSDETAPPSGVTGIHWAHKQGGQLQSGEDVSSPCEHRGVKPVSKGAVGFQTNRISQDEEKKNTHTPFPLSKLSAEELEALPFSKRHSPEYT